MYGRPPGAEDEVLSLSERKKRWKWYAARRGKATRALRKAIKEQEAVKEEAEERRRMEEDLDFLDTIDWSDIGRVVGLDGFE
jgi:hypothetical protein